MVVAYLRKRVQIKIDKKKKKTHVGQGIGDTEQTFSCPLPNGVMWQCLISPKTMCEDTQEALPDPLESN